MFEGSSCESTPLYKEPRNWLNLALLYVAIHFTRATIAVAFMPLLTRWGYGLTRKELLFLVFGGLRGAVGLAMGLLVEHNSYIDKDLAKIISFHVSGIVLLTLLVNGTTVD